MCHRKSGKIHQFPEIMAKAIRPGLIANQAGNTGCDTPALQLEQERTENIKNLSRDKSIVDLSEEDIIEWIESIEINR